LNDANPLSRIPPIEYNAMVWIHPSNRNAAAISNNTRFISLSSGNNIKNIGKNVCDSKIRG
jgi:hypothetical protein